VINTHSPCLILSEASHIHTCHRMPTPTRVHLQQKGSAGAETIRFGQTMQAETRLPNCNVSRERLLTTVAENQTMPPSSWTVLCWSKVDVEMLGEWSKMSLHVSVVCPEKNCIDCKCTQCALIKNSVCRK